MRPRPQCLLVFLALFHLAAIIVGSVAQHVSGASKLRGGGGGFWGGGEAKRECKFVVVTGGVLSGIGKGVTASSIGVLCKMMGLRPTAIKIDPYLNVDAGTMSPFEHGEVFVLDDGGETDLDLGNYERFMGVNLRNESNLTTGKIYQHVIEKERRGDYLGKTVQVVPHITDALQDWILDVSSKPVDGSNRKPDICIIELGGTLGDIESMPFVEALRQLQDRVGYKNCCFVHVSLVPVVGSPGEQKTKPTQHSVKQMRALGLAPDFIMCRGEKPLEESSRKKLAMFCNVPPCRVMSVHDVSNIYRVPLLLLEQGRLTPLWFPSLLSRRLRLVPYAKRHQPDDDAAALEDAVPLEQRRFEEWQNLADTFDSVLDEARVALVGKYTDLHDTYLSVVKALLHAALANRRRLVVEWIDSSSLEDTEPPLSSAAVPAAAADSAVAAGPGSVAAVGGVAAVTGGAAVGTQAGAPVASVGETAVVKGGASGGGADGGVATGRVRGEDGSVAASKLAWEALQRCDAVLVPGGFGERGLEGKIRAIRYARENKVPFLGICLGMQAAVIEFARNVLGVADANSAEFASAAVTAPPPPPAANATATAKTARRRSDGTAAAAATAVAAAEARTAAAAAAADAAANAFVVFMPEGSRERLGGTMRLGSRDTVIEVGSIAHRLYQGRSGEAAVVKERHRHRYEVNPDKVPALEAAGLRFVGRNRDATGERMEVLELPADTHPFFVAAQYHPEFKSRPGKPSPLFMGFLASIPRKRQP
ncbi:unnamed protein product [Phaeothamnion confervicola]